MATSEAQKRATLKYRENKMSRITLDMKTEMKETIKKRANEKGLSMQGYIFDLIKKDLGKEKQQ